MKAMKKILAGMMALTMSLSLAACSSNDNKQQDVKTDVEGATVYKVGIVQYVSHASLDQIVENIEKRLDERGAELGVTFNYTGFYQNGNGEGAVIDQITANLVADQVDIIVPVATRAAISAMVATEENNIPVVFSAVSDPVSSGLVSSMDVPGANVTGTSDALNTNSIMDLIFAVDPDCDYVGLLYDMGQDSSTQPIAEAKAYLDAKNIKYVEKTGTNSGELMQAAESLVAEGVDAVFTPTDNTVMDSELAFYETFADANIPHYGGADSFALNGAFCGYGVDYTILGQMTADMIVDILVNGADPAATPVMTFDNGIATVNTEIASAMGLDLEQIKEQMAPYCTQVAEITTAESFK